KKRRGYRSRGCGECGKAVPDGSTSVERAWTKLRTVCTAFQPVRRQGGQSAAGRGKERKLSTGAPPIPHRPCLMRVVSSWTTLNASLSSFSSRVILFTPCRTVEWSRPPNLVPILGSETSVSSRQRYIARCRG